MLPEGYAIRRLTVEDAPAMAAAYRRNREHLEPTEPVHDESFFTVEGQQDALARQLSLVQGGLAARWVLERAGEIVGRVSLNNIVHGALSSAAVGYWVDREHLRRGLATAAVGHACEQALALGLHRVEAGTLVDNVASQRVLLRAGFEQYGMAPGFLFIAGAWRDHNLYQRLLHDEPLPASRR